MAHLNGVTYKLASIRGTVLGTITVPLYHALNLKEAGSSRFFLPPKDMPSALSVGEAQSILQARTGMLTRCPWADDAVVLHGLSIEELEQCEGFAFAVGAGYLRSLLEGDG